MRASLLSSVVYVTLTAVTFIAQGTDQWRACMDKALGQNEMNRCAGEELARSDAELNDVYRKLLAAAANQPNAVTKITAAERAWIVYRDAYIEARYPAEDKAPYGSIFPMEVNLLRANLTRQQIEALKNLLKEYSASSSTAEDAFKTFLQGYLKDDDKNVRYFDAFVDLNDDGKPEVIAHVVGGSRCGSGGCPTFVFTPDGPSYKLVTKISITRPPVRMLDTKLNGWHSLTVWVQGGGIQSGYDAILTFNGKTYPANPTVAPAQKATGKPAGKELLPDGDARNLKTLYP